MSIYRRALFHGVARIISLPRLSLPLIITLGLTLGAVLSVIAIVSVLLFKPLPGIKDEKTLHSITMELVISDSLHVSYLNWRRMADFQKTFADVGDWAAIRANENQTVINDVTYPVVSYIASTNILDVLGTSLIKGQGTDVPSPEEKVWISKSLWQSAFSGREAAIGQSILVRDKSYVVAGVIEDLSSVSYAAAILPQQIWLINDPATLLSEPEVPSINAEVPSLVVRTNQPLPSDAEIRAWFNDYLENNSPAPQYLEFIKSKELRISNGSYRDSLISESETLVVMLFAAVIGLLLMASLNLLNLFIAHYQSRSKEFAIQVSLGASLTRLRLMLILENLPSFLVAAVLGLLLTGWALRGVPTIAGEALPLLDLLVVDVFTQFMAVVIVLVLAVTFSLIGLVDVNKQALSESLNSSGKGVQGQTNQWLSRGLMVLQLSLASLLLTGSVMLAKQSYDAVYQPLGYNLNNGHELNWAYGDEEWASQLGDFENYQGSGFQQLHQDLSNAIEQLFPGSEVVTASGAPLAEQIDISSIMDPALPEQIMFLNKDLSHNSLSAFDIELIAGEAPTKAQIEANEDFIIIDERMAQRAFPGMTPAEVIGKTISMRIGEGDKQIPITGIVNNVMARVGSLDNMNFPAIYRSAPRVQERLRLTVMMPDGESIDDVMLAKELGRQFPRLIDLEVQSLADRWDEQTLNQRISLAVILTMTGLTLFLAVIGVAGLTQMTTNQKRYELAVRMATGAKQWRLLGIVFKEAMWMLVIGLSLGFVISVAGYTEIKESVSIMPDFDWLSMVVLDGGLIAIVTLAVALPAWRIIKADPMQALREL